MAHAACGRAGPRRHGRGCAGSRRTGEGRSGQRCRRAGRAECRVRRIRCTTGHDRQRRRSFPNRCVRIVRARRGQQPPVACARQRRRRRIGCGHGRRGRRRCCCTTKTAKGDAAKGAKVAAHGKTDTKADTKAEARKRHKEQQAELAQAKKHRDATPARTAKAGTKDDPDADLLAALVARTKPADKKLAAQKAQPVPTKTAATTGSLASRVKECSERGFFEDQLCRWRVCDGHWGKDPACPSAAQSETRQ